MADIVVTSDDPEVLRIARDRDCIAIERPWYLADDESPTIRAVWHALSMLPATLAAQVQAVCLLQPTNPLRLPTDVDAAIELMGQTGCDSVHTVAPCHCHPARQLWGDGTPVLRGEYRKNTRRQDLATAYDRDGAVYLTRLSTLYQGSWYGWHRRILVIPRERHLDIEDEHDLRIADALITRSCTDARGVVESE